MFGRKVFSGKFRFTHTLKTKLIEKALQQRGDGVFRRNSYCDFTAAEGFYQVRLLGICVMCKWQEVICEYEQLIS